MRHPFKIFILSALCVGLAMSSCKEEKKVPQKTQVKKVVKKKKVTPKPKPVPAPVKKVVKPEAKYFLISASFQHQKNAEQFQGKLKQDGFTSRIHPASNGFFRVSYMEFSDRKEAFQALRSARSTEEHKDVWLYIKS
ncbi:MAG: SPOR domain-containing protein [Marinifilaceae bacterium]